jgi:dTDP-4-amino-4,6-dideoxygalactose transaminase
MFTRSARSAWRLILESTRFSTGTSVLVPAYVGVSDREGSGLWDPIEQTGAPFTLYALDDKLRPDHDALEALLATSKHPLLLVVHYFGMVQADLHRLRRACLRHGTLLIEDCAHVPGPQRHSGGPGSVGDAAFYSLHKSIAVSSGGLLRINKADWRLPEPPVSDRCDPTCLEQLLRTDLDAVAAARRENYRWLSARFVGTDGLTVLYPNFGEYVPHDFPVRIHDGRREKLYFALMAEDLPTVALYYRLIDAIRPEAFPISHELSRSILNLPVHQDTELADLKHLSDRLVALLADLRR